ncbi:MAG: hypothetical protein JNK15_09040 [Planctomycetes bacterium]|nr:hypothetical protein [Planctomycetota bacterium]
MSTLHPLFLLPAVAIVGSLAAQEAMSAAVADADPRIAVHSNAAQPGDAPYGTWAAGAAYKASFHGGMTFYPLLGRDYPRNQPWSWRTTSVRVGNGELLGTGVVPVLSHSDYRVEYTLGPVVEAYDVRSDGLEQTFVLAQRPGRGGDLCISGQVRTDLSAEPVVELHGDLVFRDAAGTALVRYGRALAIDADGDTFAMTTTWTGDSITLRLSADALEQADFPLVVDPLLSAALSMTLTNMVALGEMDGASEDLNPTLSGAYCVTRHYSATDADVYARICNADFSGAVTRFSDLSASSTADHGRVAFVAATNKWVVCYQSLNLGTQIMQVRAAMFSGGAASPTTTVSVALVEAAGVHDWRPCVGGVEAGGAGTQALVAFQRETGPAVFAGTSDSEVHGVFFDTTSALGSFGVPFPVLASGVFDYERPAISRAAVGGATSSWLVACQTWFYTSNPAWHLSFRLVSNSGPATGVSQIFPQGEHFMGPRVDGRDGRYLVTFAVCDDSVAAPVDERGTAIRCKRIDWQYGDPAANPLSNLPEQTLSQNSLRILENGGVAFHRSTQSHWTLAWRSSSTAPAIYATRVGYRGVPIYGPELVDSSSATFPGWPTVACDRDDVAVVGFQRHQGSSGGVWARTWINPTTPAQTLSTPNCSPAYLVWNGPVATTNNAQQWIGGELSQITASSAPANSLHLMLVGTGTVDVPVVDPILGTNCSLLVPLSGPDHLGILPVAIGASAAWTLPLPENLPAMTLHFQDWILDPADNRLWGSRRRSVPITK